MTYFKTIQLRSWRQFKAIDIEFSGGVTILTGRNGTGKTSILNILAKHASHKLSFLGEPTQRRDSAGRFTSGYWGGAHQVRKGYEKIGSISYNNDLNTDVTVTRTDEKSFDVFLTDDVVLDVLNLSSHRRVPAYKEVGQISTKPFSSKIALQKYQAEQWTSMTGGISRNPPLLHMKEAIISMAAFGPGNQYLAPNADAFDMFKEFESKLKEILPKNIGFRKLKVEPPDVILETVSGNFLIYASSGGLMSLIDLTWEITLYSHGKEYFVVLLDEPENHLHPSMQREFLPALADAFPGAQFIVATHSPFVVSSVKSAKIYVFDVESSDDLHISSFDYSASKNVVVSKEINPKDRKSASNVLRDVIGVPVSMPIWAEEELDRILDDFSDSNFGPAEIRALKATLDERDLGDFLPEVVVKLSGS